MPKALHHTRPLAAIVEPFPKQRDNILGIDEIVASGYEFECPHCTEMLRHYELSLDVLRCPTCNGLMQLDVGRAEHAYG